MNYLSLQKAKFVAIAAFSLLFFTLSVLAQQGPPPLPQQQQNVKEDYSENELKEFIEANKEATKVQQAGQNKMISAIEEEGLDVNTFNQIITAQQNPRQSAEPDVSENEMNKFNKAVEKVMTIQQSMESEVTQAIESTGMDSGKYGEIMLAYQQSPVVQEKVHKLLEQEK